MKSLFNFCKDYRKSRQTNLRTRVPFPGQGEHNVIEIDNANNVSVYLGLDYVDYKYLSNTYEKYGIPEVKDLDEKVFDINRNFENSNNGEFIIITRQNNKITGCYSDCLANINTFEERVNTDIYNLLNSENSSVISKSTSPSLSILTDVLGIYNLRELKSYSSKEPQKIFDEIFSMINAKTKSDKDAILVLDLPNKKVLGKKAFSINLYGWKEYAHMRWAQQFGLIEYPDYPTEYVKSYMDFRKRYLSLSTM